MSESRRLAFFLGPITGLGLFLRWWKLTRLGLGTDELNSVFYAARPEFISTDSHTPLFYLLLRPFGAIFGWTEFAAHLLPTVVSSALLVYLLARALRAPGESRLANAWLLALVALGPLDLILAREVRMYGLMLALSNLALFLALDYAERPTRKRLAGLTAVLALNAFNHPAALLFLCALLAFIGGRLLARREKIDRPALCAAAALAALPVLGFYLFSNDKFQSARAQIAWITPPGLDWPLRLFQYFSGVVAPLHMPRGVGFELALCLAVSGLLTGAIAIAGRRTTGAARERLRWLFVNPPGLLAPFLLAQILALIALPLLNVFEVRYFTALYPLALYLCAWALASISRRTWRVVLPATCVALLAFDGLGRELFAFQPGPREHFTGFLAMPYDGLKIDCDYGKNSLAKGIIYPQYQPMNFVHCFSLLAFLRQHPGLPPRIAIYVTDPTVSDLGRVIGFLAQRGYRLIEDRALPGEPTHYLFYELKSLP